jgi:hypothetical protein
VFSEDMNMGPSQEGQFSVHYADQDDAEARCASYESMRTGCGFEEVHCEDMAYRDDICRFLVQGVVIVACGIRLCILKMGRD